MGLIKAAFGSAGGVLADQWKEFFYCDALDKNTLVVRGQKKTTRRSSNTKGNDNVISNGSGIAVADGQCMIIVDQGKVAEVCAEPGEFTWDSSSEPSVFTGKFGDSLKKTFTAIGKRFSYGGDPGKDQRVYYFNTKEILDNKFGTATPIDFRVVDSRVGIDRDVRLRVNGTYSYRISDPILFYTNVCGNVAGSYERSELDGQLKTEFVSALMPAVGRMSELELRPNQLMNHTKELRDYLNQELTAEWAEKRGLSVVSVALGGVTLSEEDAELLRQDQRPRAVMHRQQLAAVAGRQRRQQHRLSAAPAALHHAQRRFDIRPGTQGRDLLQALRAYRHHDLVDQRRLIQRPQRPQQHRHAAQRRRQLIRAAHALRAPRGRHQRRAAGVPFLFPV